MNEGLRLLYEQILVKEKEFTTCLIGSYGLNGYMDMQHVYLNWEKYKDSSCITIRPDRFAISMLDGEYTFREYRL